MTPKNEEHRRRLQYYRMKIGFIIIAVIEVPLVLLLFFLNSYHVIDSSLFSLGVLLASLGCLAAALLVPDLLLRRKQTV